MKKVLMAIVLLVWISGSVHAGTWTRHDVDGSFPFPIGICAGQFNVFEDSCMDIVVGYHSPEKYVWYENDGSSPPNFATVVIWDSTQGGVGEVFAADLDGNGTTDFVSTLDEFNDIIWYRNDGLGGWTKEIIDGGLDAHSVYAADVDCDGDIDVISGGRDAPIYWFENSGTGSFTPRLILNSTNVYIVNFCLGDLDYDCHMEVFAADSRNHAIRWWKNDGAEVFTQMPWIPLGGVHGVAVGDVDCDEDVDIVATGNAGDSVVWCPNNGSNVFDTIELLKDEFHGGAMDIVITDVNGNSVPDIIGCAEGTGQIIRWESDGQGGFLESIVDTSFSQPIRLWCEDMNDDGAVDILCAGQYITWWENPNDWPRPDSLFVISDSYCLDPSLMKIELSVHNEDTVGGMTVPLRFDTDCPGFSIDSVVFDSTRIEDWEYKNVDIRSDTLILALVADMGAGTPCLPPGEGPIAFVYFSVECNPENVNDSCHVSVDTCTFQPDNQGLLFVDSDARAYVPYFESGTTCVAQYKPGDTNCDCTRNLADVIYLLNYLFRNGPEPCPLDAGDVNGDCAIDIGDPVYLLNWLFKFGSPPVCGCALHPETAGCCPNGRSWSNFAKTVGQAELGLVVGTRDKGTSFEITGSLSTDVAGLQLEISYDPEKVTSIVPTLTERTNTLQLFSSARNGLLKLGIVDLAAKNLIKAGDGLLVRLDITGGDLSSIEINTAVAVDQDAKPLNVRILPKSEAGAARPATFSLHQNHPNPFNPETDISYSIPVDGRVALSIYNVRGQKVKTLVESNQAAGYYTVHWDGTDEQGRKVASGIYFYRLQAGERTETKKMILMK